MTTTIVPHLPTEMTMTPALARQIADLLIAQRPTDTNYRNGLNKAVEQVETGRAYELCGNVLHVQSSEHDWQWYDCTMTACASDCPAWQERGLWCWHRCLLQIVTFAQTLLAITTAGQLATESQQAALAILRPRQPRRRVRVAKDPAFDRTALAAWKTTHVRAEMSQHDLEAACNDGLF